MSDQKFNTVLLSTDFLKATLKAMADYHNAWRTAQGLYPLPLGVLVDPYLPESDSMMIQIVEYIREAGQNDYMEQDIFEARDQSFFNLHCEKAEHIVREFLNFHFNMDPFQYEFRADRQNVGHVIRFISVLVTPIKDHSQVSLIAYVYFNSHGEGESVELKLTSYFLSKVSLKAVFPPSPAKNS
jgi:hypothetical protein